MTTMLADRISAPLRWVGVCDVDDLIPERGACALVNGRQVAVFLVGDGDVRAIDNHDPFSGANVMARGIVGSIGGKLKVASPIYKQTFDLDTGVCFDDPSVTLPVYAVRVRAGRVEVAVT